MWPSPREVTGPPRTPEGIPNVSLFLVSKQTASSYSRNGDRTSAAIHRPGKDRVVEQRTEELQVGCDQRDANAAQRGDSEQRHGESRAPASWKARVRLRNWIIQAAGKGRRRRRAPSRGFDLAYLPVLVPLRHEITERQGKK